MRRADLAGAGWCDGFWGDGLCGCRVLETSHARAGAMEQRCQNSGVGGRCGERVAGWGVRGSRWDGVVGWKTAAAATPPGSWIRLLNTGGIVALRLNHRLMAIIPPGCREGRSRRFR